MKPPRPLGGPPLIPGPPRPLKPPGGGPPNGRGTIDGLSATSSSAILKFAELKGKGLLSTNVGRVLFLVCI